MHGSSYRGPSLPSKVGSVRDPGSTPTPRENVAPPLRGVGRGVGGENYPFPCDTHRQSQIPSLQQLIQQTLQGRGIHKNVRICNETTTSAPTPSQSFPLGTVAQPQQHQQQPLTSLTVNSGGSSSKTVSLVGKSTTIDGRTKARESEHQ
jgi:hypothetical protein